MTRDQLITLDQNDPLAHYYSHFDLPADTIYLDGNSLGPPLKGLHEHLRQLVEDQWRTDLISSWNKHGWFQLATKLGAQLAPLIGAQPSEVMVTDSVSINLFKLIVAALRHQAPRRKILSLTNNFPTDLYIAEGVADLLTDAGVELVHVQPEQLLAAMTDEVAVVVLSQVVFRSGNLLDCEAINTVAKRYGVLVVWDLCHSVGVLPLDVNDLGIELAVGCTYKFLNGGPGAPAFVFVANHRLSQMQQPISGWFGHAKPFAFSPHYQPSASIERFQTGTPSILALATLQQALSVWEGIDLQSVRKKSLALSETFIVLIKQQCADCGFGIVTSEEADQRGSHVALTHDHGYSIVQALVADKVIGDFRAPDIMRFGFAPLYIRYQDVWDAVQQLKRIMHEQRYTKPEYQVQQVVT